MKPSEHRMLKGVDKGEVRDHMTGLELAFVNVAEQATIVNIQTEDAQGYDENYDAGEKGGRAAGVARLAFEEEHGRKVISAQSYLEQRKKLESSEEVEEPEYTCRDFRLPPTYKLLRNEEYFPPSRSK